LTPATLKDSFQTLAPTELSPEPHANFKQEYNKKFRITFFFTVPPIYLLIAKMPIVTDHFDSLEIAISGAAPLGKELQHAASAKLGKGKTFISQTWGLSETTGSVTGMPVRASLEDGHRGFSLFPTSRIRNEQFIRKSERAAAGYRAYADLPTSSGTKMTIQAVLANCYQI
jgi:acyl-CoA synthetase (AMP-forming)/AMP-acid ligase II